MTITRLSEEKYSKAPALSFQGVLTPLVNLENKFQSLLDIETDDNQKRKNRYDIMYAVYQELCSLEKHKAGLISTEFKKKPSWSEKMMAGLKWVGFGLAVFFSMVIGSIGVYIGSREILTTIPQITNPVSIAISAFLVVIESILFLSFEAQLIKEMMGVNKLDEKHPYSWDEKELELTEKINKKINLLTEYSENRENLKIILPFLGIIGLFNNRILTSQKKYKQEYKEPSRQKIFRIAVTILGAVLEIVGGYFVMNSILLGLSAALIGTPLGWVITGIGISTFLLMFLSTRGKGMVNLMNPALKKFNLLKEKMKGFTPINKILVPNFEKTEKLHQIIPFSVIHKNNLNKEFLRKSEASESERMDSVNSEKPIFTKTGLSIFNGFSLFQSSCQKAEKACRESTSSHRSLDPISSYHNIS